MRNTREAPHSLLNSNIHVSAFQEVEGRWQISATVVPAGSSSHLPQAQGSVTCVLPSPTTHHSPPRDCSGGYRSSLGNHATSPSLLWSSSCSQSTGTCCSDLSSNLTQIYGHSYVLVLKHTKKVNGLRLML